MALFVVCQLLNAIGGGIGQCVSWSLMADAMDYEAWKFGTRNEGTTYALHSFFRKLAQGIGPSLGLMAATWLGYNAALGANQTIEVATNMRYLTAGAYLLSAVLQLIAYGVIYNLDKKTLAQMEKISASAATTPRPISPRSSAAKTDSDRSPSNIFTLKQNGALPVQRAVFAVHLAAGYGNCCRGWRKPCQNRSERQLSPPSIFLYSEVSHVRV